MTPQTIEYLNALNRQFYQTTATEFDATRSHAWQGWLPLLPYLTLPLRVLDVGCGNGRLGVFLAEQLQPQPETPVDYHGIDNSAALLAFAHTALAKVPHLTFTLTEQDIIAQPELPAQTYDLVTLFGVIHHVPGYALRHELMRRLAACVAPGGILAFASWRFYEHDRFRERIIPWSDDIEVEPGDYLLDWRRGETALRYCHYVDDAEQASLIAATSMIEINTYISDIYNCYSMVRKL